MPIVDKSIASIVIPTFNGGSRITHCLDALVEQAAGRRVEILVVNDGSTDNTADLVQRYPDVRLITQANAGPAAARNRGSACSLRDDHSLLPMMIAYRRRTG